MKSNHLTRRVALFAAAASSLILTAVPAQAKDAPTPAAMSTGQRPAAEKICVKETQPGSRLPRKVCRTADEWEVERLSRQQKAFDPNQRL